MNIDFWLSLRIDIHFKVQRYSTDSIFIWFEKENFQLYSFCLFLIFIMFLYELSDQLYSRHSAIMSKLSTSSSDFHSITSSHTTKLNTFVYFEVFEASSKHVCFLFVRSCMYINNSINKTNNKTGKKWFPYIIPYYFVSC